MLTLTKIKIFNIVRDETLKYFGFTDSILFNSRRKESEKICRWTMIWICHKIYNARTTDMLFWAKSHGYGNGWDHTTVIHINKALQNDIDTDVSFKVDHEVALATLIPIIDRQIALNIMPKKSKFISTKQTIRRHINSEIKKHLVVSGYKEELLTEGVLTNIYIETQDIMPGTSSDKAYAINALNILCKLALELQLYDS